MHMCKIKTNTRNQVWVEIPFNQKKFYGQKMRTELANEYVSFRIGIASLWLVLFCFIVLCFGTKGNDCHASECFAVCPCYACFAIVHTTHTHKQKHIQCTQPRIVQESRFDKHIASSGWFFIHGICLWGRALLLLILIRTSVYGFSISESVLLLFLLFEHTHTFSFSFSSFQTVE